MYVGDMLLDCKEISQLNLKRPVDRVRSCTCMHGINSMHTMHLHACRVSRWGTCCRARCCGQTRRIIAMGTAATAYGSGVCACVPCHHAHLRLVVFFPQGYLVGWDLEREIWGHAFKAVLGLNLVGGRQAYGSGGSLTPRECGLLLTEPIFNFPQLQALTEQVGGASIHLKQAEVQLGQF